MPTVPPPPRTSPELNTSESTAENPAVASTTSNTQSSDDRRIYQRTPIELRLEYKRVNSFFAEYTRNISKGGTFVATKKPLPVGTEFVFRLVAPGLPNPLELKGQVAHVVDEESASEKQPAGMGIRFVYQTDTERETVYSVVENLMTTSLGPVLSRELLKNVHQTSSETNTTVTVSTKDK